MTKISNYTNFPATLYSRKENRLWFFFGDTFNTPLPSDGNWRGTVIGKMKHFDPEDFKFETFALDDKGFAKDQIFAHHSKNDEYVEVTKICQGVVEVNGDMYAFYESIRHWGEPGYWDVNYSGAIKSTDGGKTWERLYDLTWPETFEGPYAKLIKDLAEEDMNLKPSGHHININERVAPAFGQMYPLDGKDGYIYIYGRHGGRQHGIVVGRVLKENIECFDKYEYFNGYDSSNNPIWNVGVKGLKEIYEHEDKCRIIEPVVSNMTVFYNPYLAKWVIMFFKSKVGIVFHLAETPYGKYDEEHILIGNDYPFPFGKYIYGGFSHEMLQSENGQKIYFIVSQWTDQLYGSELYEVKFK